MFQATKPYRPSYGWRIIWEAKSLISVGTKRIIGTGQETLVWSNKWIPDTDPKPASSSLAGPNPSMKVSELIDRATNSWSIQRLRACNIPSDIPWILSLRPSMRLTNDEYRCHYTKTGNYMVKSGMRFSAGRWMRTHNSSFHSQHLIQLRHVCEK